jgi:hypothetical protein
MGTFAPDGPERCSGLLIMRYDAGILGTILGTDFELMDSRRHHHTTPWGAVQRFQFSTFRRAYRASWRDSRIRRLRPVQDVEHRTR